MIQHTRVCKAFKFEKKGVTNNATFSGAAVLMQEGLFLVAKSVTKESENVAGAMFGLLGMMIASKLSSLAKMDYPYSVVTCNELPDQVRELQDFRNLKDKHRIVIVDRSEILGYMSSFLGGFKLVCTGEDIVLVGSKKKLKSFFDEYGYSEYDPTKKAEDQEPEAESQKVTF